MLARPSRRVAPGGFSRRFVAVLAMVPALLLTTPFVSSVSTAAAPSPPLAYDVLTNADLTRPRIIMTASDLPVVQARLGREPYRSMLHDLQVRADAAPVANPADQPDCNLTVNRNREEQKSRAAMDLAFLYLVDRVSDPATDDAVVPSAAQRQSIGDRSRDLLRWMCTKSRIPIQFDRDINTSNELLSESAAYDALAGAGYDFAGYEPTIVDNIATLTTEFFHNYNDPTNTNPNILAMTLFATNNHRSKSAASMGVAALALVGSPVSGIEPGGWRDPARWLDFGLERVDLVQRWTYGAGDGGYGEGLGYWRLSSENIVPFEHAWDRLAGGQTTRTAAGVEIPSMWRSPQFAQMQQWALDLTLPDGTLAPIDDSKVGERAQFGLFPDAFAGSSQLGWRWQHATVPYESENNIDMAPFSIVAYDDTSTKAPVEGSADRFYAEGGNVVYRSDWGTDAVMVAIEGEHGSAEELGRTRAGVGELWSAAHDHADPGAYLMQGYGERLLLDPGYMDYPWSQQGVLNKPGDHNLVIVDSLDQPQQPANTFAASAAGAAATAFTTDPGADFPVDGNAQISDTFDSPGLAGSTVTASYGITEGQPALVRRRFLFVDDRYLISADSLSSPVSRTYTWPVNGNGGGSDGVMPALPYKSPAVAPPEGAAAIAATPYLASGGTFTQTSAGGEWTRPAARVTTAMAFDTGTPTASTAERFYEQRRSSLGQYTALLTSVTGTDVDALGIAYPTPTSQSAPVISRVAIDGAAALAVTDVGGDARVFVLSRPAGSGPITVPASVTGSRSITTDGSLVVLQTTMAGTVTSISAENATFAAVAGGPSLDSPVVSTLSVRLPGDGTAAVVAHAGVTPSGSSDASAAPGPPDPVGMVEVGGLGFDAVAADAACTAVLGPGSALVPLARQGAVRLRAGAGNQAPAADPGGSLRVAAGSTVTLDGRGSCDPDGDALAPHWTLTSAPAGSNWSLAGADGWRPQLTTEVNGPYRLTLTVTDRHGSSSTAASLLVLAGSAAADQVDDDLDGVFDHADPDGDTAIPLVVAEPPPPTTTSTSSTVDPGSSTTTSAVGAGSASPPAPPPPPTSGGGAGSSLPLTGWAALVPALTGVALIVVGGLALATTRRRARP